MVEEAERNPEFATRLAALLPEAPPPKAPRAKAAAKPAAKAKAEALDVYAEWHKRGETEFRLWLRGQPVKTLQGVIKTQDLDGTGRTTKWKEAEKLADFISDALSARTLRGSAFLGRGA
jgi:hypothetical protein